LNVPQTSHQVIVDTRWEEGYKIYDPQMGNEGSKFYVPHYYRDLIENAVRWDGGWHIDFRILECPALGVIA
jgi:hypothetical protein